MSFYQKITNNNKKNYFICKEFIVSFFKQLLNRFSFVSGHIFQLLPPQFGGKLPLPAPYISFLPFPSPSLFLRNMAHVYFQFF